jgi:hypothetical protein
MVGCLLLFLLLIIIINPLSGNVPWCSLPCFTLSNARQFYSSRGECWHWWVNIIVLLFYHYIHVCVL